MTVSRALALVGIGTISGFFSGLFGIGGGLIIVPALVVLLKLDHKRAVATSLLAIMPAVTVSLIAYAVQGSVLWGVGVLLAVGAVAGAQLGAWLLRRISRRLAQWIFVGFVAVMVVQLLIVIPSRDAVVVLDWLNGAGLLVLGLVAGALSSLLGIGGGGVAVPIMMVWFGLGDLAAKGAALVMMLPGVGSGLYSNLRRHMVNIRAGVIIGLGAVLTGPLGAWVAHLISPQLASWLFAAFLAFIGISMAREALRPPAPAGA
ncbi:MAG: sulfite exporter TauE/SafE family protein [Propionicimonas sp.]